MGSTVHTYLYAGGKLIRETAGSDTLDFVYDHLGHPYALKHTTGGVTTTYYYITNLQGDVLGLVNASGTAVASYTYDPYGKVLTSTGSLANTNPLRYRGYYYDTETGLYYLQSRYYDPAIHRFLNADSYASTGQGILGHNMFAYCLNNPVIFIDITGHKPAYSLDTDEDGEDDCFVYVYHYHERVRRKSRRLRGYTINITGKVYIFTGRSQSDFEVMKYPDGFNKYTDLMVLDETWGADQSMFAYQAQHVNPRYHSHIIACMMQYDEDFNTPWDRSESSLSLEWRAHNLFALLDESAQNIDFDNAEEGYGWSDYFKKAYNRAIEKYF